MIEQTCFVSAIRDFYCSPAVGYLPARLVDPGSWGWFGVFDIQTHTLFVGHAIYFRKVRAKYGASAPRAWQLSFTRNRANPKKRIEEESAPTRKPGPGRVRELNARILGARKLIACGPSP